MSGIYDGEREMKNVGDWKKNINVIDEKMEGEVERVEREVEDGIM